jgi:hypothetical protein
MNGCRRIKGWNSFIRIDKILVLSRVCNWYISSEEGPGKGKEPGIPAPGVLPANQQASPAGIYRSKDPYRRCGVLPQGKPTVFQGCKGGGGCGSVVPKRWPRGHRGRPTISWPIGGNPTGQDAEAGNCYRGSANLFTAIGDRAQAVVSLENPVTIYQRLGKTADVKTDKKQIQDIKLIGR